MITSPCRSTKCRAWMTKPSVLGTRGDPEQERGEEPDHVLHAPSGDPTDEHEQRRRQVVRNDAQDRRDLGDRGALRVHPRVEQHDGEIAETEGEPVASQAVGMAMAITRNPPIPPSKSSRKRRRSVAIAFVNHA